MNTPSRSIPRSFFDLPSDVIDAVLKIAVVTYSRHELGILARSLPLVNRSTLNYFRTRKPALMTTEVDNLAEIEEKACSQTRLCNFLSVEAGTAGMQDLKLLELPSLSTLQELEIDKCQTLQDISSISKLTALRELHIDDLVRVADVSCIERCTQLTYLFLGQSWYVDFQIFPGIADISPLSKCAELRCVGLSGLKISGVEALSHCVKLEEVWMNGLEQLTDITPLGVCTKLVKLETHSTPISNLPLELGNCKVLKKLAVSESQLTNVSGLLGIRTLEKFYLENSDAFGYSLSGLEGSLGNLKIVRLGGCGEITHINELRECTSLTELCLTGCQFLESIEGLRGCAQLKTLRLAGCDEISRFAPLGFCTNLEVLSLRSCFQLENITPLRNPLFNCANLKCLDLSWCSELMNNESLALLASSCSALEVFLLQDFRIKDASVLKRFSSLKSLFLNKCRLLEDISGLGNLSSLLKLSLEGCGSLVDVSALAACPQLMFLDVRDCAKVQDLSALEHHPSIRAILVSREFASARPNTCKNDAREIPNSILRCDNLGEFEDKLGICWNGHHESLPDGYPQTG